MRFHVLSVPHTVANDDYLNCAFTQNVRRVCRMLRSLGHTVYFYGHDRSEVMCTEHVPVMDDASLAGRFGAREFQTELTWLAHDDRIARLFNERTIAGIRERRQPGDFILCCWGSPQRPVAEYFPECLVVEPAIGYPPEAVFAPYRVFVSQAWMHHVYGRIGVGTASWYDAVIPNAVDPGDFEFRADKGDDLLYLGRIVAEKGIALAIRLAQTVGRRLIVAGTGSLASLGYEIGDHVVHVGFADHVTRKRLLRDARCLLLPTHYLEPFGCVVVEALMSGTPVITTDWGAFPEINLHGITGYRCRTFDQFVWAVEHIEAINPRTCRAWAAENFAAERVAAMFEEYFRMLAWHALDKGFYEPAPGRRDLGWLYRSYPAPPRDGPRPA